MTTREFEVTRDLVLDTLPTGVLGDSVVCVVEYEGEEDGYACEFRYHGVLYRFVELIDLLEYLNRVTVERLSNRATFLAASAEENLDNSSYFELARAEELTAEAERIRAFHLD